MALMLLIDIRMHIWIFSATWTTLAKVLCLWSVCCKNSLVELMLNNSSLYKQFFFNHLVIWCFQSPPNLEYPICHYVEACSYMGPAAHIWVRFDPGPWCSLMHLKLYFLPNELPSLKLHFLPSEPGKYFAWRWRLLLAGFNYYLFTHMLLEAEVNFHVFKSIPQLSWMTSLHILV